MKYIFFILISGLLVSHCGNENKDNKHTNTETGKTDSITPVTDVSGCYRRILARDTFTAILEQKESAINGKLIFDNYQKDGSAGDVKGKIEGDIIKLIYTFNSEGMRSVMHVYFRSQHNGLIRGIGDMETRGDTAYFKNKEMIIFPEDENWSKISCDEVNDILK